MRWSLLLMAAAALLAVSAASAKTLQKVVAVGAGGASLELTGINEVDLYGSPARVAPTSRFVLLYPLMEEDVPAQPGRYYPDLHVACFSWNRHVVGRCYTADKLGDGALADLPTLRTPPALVRSLVIHGLKMPVRSNGIVAIELAFNRPALTQPAPSRPKGCSAARARWSGPQAAARPTRFWTCSTGIWSAGKLYPTGPLMF